jgi:2-methylcitrate dehydratase PrpD
VTENGFTLLACCGHTHTAVDSAIALRTEQGWSTGEARSRISAIHLALYGPGYAIVREPNPRTPYQAKFSIAYCVAAGLMEGRVGLEQFDDARFSIAGVIDAGIASLLERTTVVVDGALSERYPERWPSRMILTMRDGTVLEREADFPLGHPENPVPDSVLKSKARDLLEPRFGERVSSRVVALVDRLAAIEDIAVEMSVLMSGATEQPCSDDPA